MSEEIKMSDIWGWDSIPQSYGHYQSFTLNGNECKGDFYGLLFCTEEAANAVSHAVRNYDRLIEEIAQLKKDKEELRDILSVLSDVDKYSVTQVRMSMREARRLIYK